MGNSTRQGQDAEYKWHTSWLLLFKCGREGPVPLKSAGAGAIKDVDEVLDDSTVFIEFCLSSSPLNLARGEQTTDLFPNVLTTETQSHNRAMSQPNARERGAQSPDV